MYVVTEVEHIKALEGLDKGSNSGERSGKNSNAIVCCFKELEDAEEWLENVESNWCPGGEQLSSVRASWYEIWDYALLKSPEEDSDPNFVSAWTRYGKKMDSVWIPNYTTVLETEAKDIKDKFCEEALVSIEMSVDEMIEMFTEIAENATRRVVDEKFTNLSKYLERKFADLKKVKEKRSGKSKSNH